MGTHGERTLLQGVRPAVVAKYLGELLAVLGLLMLVPAAVAALASEGAVLWRYLAVAAPMALLGVWGAKRPEPRQIQRNEALAIIALAYLIAAPALAFPFTAAGIHFPDALFESISGITTTGLSVIGDIESLPASLVFGRAWNQWCGGLGIVVVWVALLMGHEGAARRLMAPASGDPLGKTARVYAREAAVAYIALSAAAMFVLAGLGMSLSNTVNYALAAVSTGGFSPQNAGLAALPGGVQRAAVTLFSVAGAVALPLYVAAARRQWSPLVEDIELRLLAVFIAVGAMLLILFHALGGAPEGIPATDLLLLAASAQSTTGFSALPVASLNSACLFTLIVAMAAGGAIGSTAGGIKLLRVAILYQLVARFLRRNSLPPHAVVRLTLGGRTLAEEDALDAAVLALLFATIILLSWLPFLVAGFDPLRGLFEVVSALATVGLSAGITGPDLPDALKAVLAVDMLLGRVEIVALLTLFFPATWLARRIEQ